MPSSAAVPPPPNDAGGQAARNASIRNALRLAVAACGTAAGVWLLCLTEAFTPGGSPVGWLAFLLIAASHLPFFLRKLPALPRVVGDLPPKGALVTALLVVLAASAVLVHRHHEQIAQRPLLPEASAQMGLLTHVTARMERGFPLYTPPYRVGDWSQRNAFPSLLSAVYTLPRRAGHEWRYASLAAVVLLGGLLAAALANVQAGILTSRRYTAVVLGAALGAGSWLALGRFVDFLHWGHAAPLWPFVFLFGWALGAGWAPVAAGSAGLLAAMNPGWLLLLPLAGIAVWKDARGREPLVLGLLIVPALLSYGYTRAEGEAMWTGVVGSLFQAGTAQAAEGTAWRFPTLHGLTDPLALRTSLYGLALAALALVGWRMYCSQRTAERALLFAAAAALVLAAAPATHFFHWAAHALLLGGIALGLAAPREAGDRQPAPPVRPQSVYLGTGTGAVLLAVAAMKLLAGFPDALNRPQTGHAQDHFQHALAGFNVPSEDHVWGSKPRMAVAFFLDRPVGGLLEIELATPGGEFTPYNPALIRVNGMPVGLYRERPGRGSYARIPLAPGEVHVGTNIVEIEARWARTPRSMNLGDDERDISLMYKGLRFLPDPFVTPRETDIARVQ